ncbi:hypothetical protein DFJ73DRAFT_880092 [Zopfochytrium polystomum]|nr:hypothetical protein DFJ73DRAFT_880092 [Zopfochytrium polystomum]
MCEDFANKDIHRFFASAPTEAECDDKALAYLGWLCDAGRAGWKAFALRVHYACDPVVRRVRLKRTLLPHWKEEGGIATLQHNGGPPTDLDAAPTPREEANEIVQKRIENLRNLEQSGWRPCPGAIPMKTESHFGTPMYWKSFTSVLLVFNKGLSPAVAVLNRSEDYGEDDESISLSCRGYLGPHLGRRLDFSLSGRWTECTWNRFFTLMFLCNADRFSVATYGLDNTAMWKKSFDCAYMVESESSTINFAGLSF